MSFFSLFFIQDSVLRVIEEGVEVNYVNQNAEICVLNDID